MHNECVYRISLSHYYKKLFPYILFISHELAYLRLKTVHFPWRQWERTWTKTRKNATFRAEIHSLSTNNGDLEQSNFVFKFWMLIIYSQNLFHIIIKKTMFAAIIFHITLALSILKKVGNPFGDKTQINLNIFTTL